MALNYLTEGDRISFEAENAMVEPYVCVEVGGTAGQVDLPSATTSVAKAIVGVIQNSASAGEAVTVQTSGVTLAVAYAAIAKGARVHSAGLTGRIDDSQDGTVGAVYIGIALEAATAGGELISVLLNCPAVAEDGGAS
jgi:predicted RecA/RadA family phage recombinase